MLLAAAAISKSFAGVHALKRVSFDLRAGEVHALVGENGAGKSTLIKVITGAELPDAGTLAVQGAPVPHMDPGLSRALGIAAIYQQPSLFPDLTVAENIALALEAGGAVAPRRLARAARGAPRAARRASAPSIDPDRLVETLSMPEQQIVEIAKAIGADARIVIMDEPTASLTDREVERLFDVIGSAARRRASASSTSRTGWRKCSRSPTASRCCATARRSRPVPRDGRRSGALDPDDGRPRDLGGFPEARRHDRRRRARSCGTCRTARPAFATCRFRCGGARSSASPDWSGRAAPSSRRRSSA